MLKKSVHTKYLCLLSQKLFFSQAFLILAPVQMDLKYPLAFHTIELTELPPALEVFYLMATFLAICARFRKFSKGYLNILMAQLFQQFWYQHQKAVFLLLSFLTGMIQNLLCYMDHLSGTVINFLIFHILSSRSLACCTCILFISLMKSIICGRFFSVTYFVCLSCQFICSCSGNCYSSFYNYVGITVFTKSSFQQSLPIVIEFVTTKKLH